RLAPLLDARGLDLWMAGEVDAASLPSPPGNLVPLGRLAPLLDARGLDLWMAGEVDAASLPSPPGNLVP
ncbi:hypothetical protein CNY89_30605, partial [Amaricoccus sp. HAR-UPW-R2A-40]